MRLKHWQGYGYVNAKKVSMKIIGDQIELHVRVEGNHEYGVRRDDEYDLYNWLVKRFDKNVPEYLEWYRGLNKVDITSGYENGTEICDYVFLYSSNKY